jgi:hypothetical protein
VRWLVPVPLLLKFLGGVVLAVTACGCDGPPQEDARQGGNAAPPEQALADLEAKLRFHGFRDPAEVKRLLGALREAARRGDKFALVNAIHFPFTTYDRGSPVREYAGPADALADYDAIFTGRVLDALREPRYESLFVRDQGAMVGDGEIWLFQYDDGVRIKAINARAFR